MVTLPFQEVTPMTGDYEGLASLPQLGPILKGAPASDQLCKEFPLNSSH